MKTMKTLTAIIIMLLLSFPFSPVKGETNVSTRSELKDTSSNYRDGIYGGLSRSVYTMEPYWGQIQLTLENGLFTNIQFSIRDSSNHEFVDSLYGVKHYSGNKIYMKQCVNDGHGIEIYPQRLMESQDLDNIDAISGATWSYNIFKASAKDALKDAKITTGVNNNHDIDKHNVQVTPNPFCSKLTLGYYIVKKCRVNLSIYDNQGKFIKNLVNQVQSAGNYSINWHDCPKPGIYYYRLKTGDIEVSGKIEKVKE
jgi:major membrane immunogen (membrane-anchored lipoprotein)